MMMMAMIHAKNIHFALGKDRCLILILTTVVISVGR